MDHHIVVVGEEGAWPKNPFGPNVKVIACLSTLAEEAVETGVGTKPPTPISPLITLMST